MLKKENIYTLIGFKLTWTSCVFGEIYISSWFGFSIGIFYLMIFFILQNEKKRSFSIILIFSLLGYTFDSILSYLDIYKINADNNFLFLPIWFLVLWPSFSSLFVNILVFLKQKTFLSIFLGFVIGPMSYYAGLKLGLANVNSYITSFFSIAFFWSLLMFLYSNNFIKVNR